jgi:archaellum component FlaC
MVNLSQIISDLKQVFEPSIAEKLGEVLSRYFDEISKSVFSAELAKLIDAVHTLSVSVNELTEAQKRSEERLSAVEDRLGKVEKVIEELSEANRRAQERLTRLEKVVEELSEANRRAEERLTRLEKVVEELAQAQKRTEEALIKLTRRVDMIQERLEGVSNSVGYSLGNTAYKALPKLLKSEGIEVIGKLVRRYYGEYQINLWGEGKRNGEKILLLGEVKVRPSKSEIRRFLKIAEEIRKSEKKETYLLFVAHDYHPSIETYLKESGIKYYWSYELE